MTDTMPVRVSDLPPANVVIQPHYRNETGTLCPWSRCRVTRLIIGCPNGCLSAILTTIDPGITSAMVTDALIDAVDVRMVVHMLRLTGTDGEWLDRITIDGHSHETNTLILTLRDSGQEFRIHVSEV